MRSPSCSLSPRHTVGACAQDEGCPTQDECTQCYAPQLFGDKGYHVYFNETEFEFALTVGRFWTNFVSSQNPNMRADKGFAFNGSTWPSAPADGGALRSNIVLDGSIRGPKPFAKTEHTLYGNPAICDL